MLRQLKCQLVCRFWSSAKQLVVRYFLKSQVLYHHAGRGCLEAPGRWPCGRLVSVIASNGRACVLARPSHISSCRRQPLPGHVLTRSRLREVACGVGGKLVKLDLNQGAKPKARDVSDLYEVTKPLTKTCLL